jgi:hypothetical protein
MVAKDADSIGKQSRGDGFTSMGYQRLSLPEESQPSRLCDIQNGMLSDAMVLHATAPLQSTVQRFCPGEFIIGQIEGNR